MKNSDLPNFTHGEEIFNAVTHIVGGAFGIIGLILGIILSIQKGHDEIGILAIIIYCISIILLYTMSSIYHFLNRNLAKKVFRIFDHCTIYLLIAGTYTPICLITLRESLIGIIIFIVVWLCAIAGIIMNAINMHAKTVKIISMTLYLVMGWCGVLVFKDLLEATSLTACLGILFGGIAYTGGVVFFSMGTKVKFAHSLWHMFCILGTVIHFVTISIYIL